MFRLKRVVKVSQIRRMRAPKQSTRNAGRGHEQHVLAYLGVCLYPDDLVVAAIARHRTGKT